MDLAVDVPGPGAASVQRGPTANLRAKGWLNPLFLRIPLLNPDRLLTRCLPWFRWTLTPAAFGGWLVICLLAWGGVWLHHDRFAASVPTILAANNWLFLLLAWVLLKTVHEFYHGLVCKKYGGYVPRCGLVLILFSPVAFVDVTSSWRFRSKWHRIYTAAAGMYVELFVASLAAIVWMWTEVGWLNQFCHNLVAMAGVSTLLFNGNFLMRFDGYYILSDLFGYQNLYGTGQKYLRYFWRRYVMGVSADALVETGRKLQFVRVYAWAALAWRLLFYVGVLLIAAAMFHGAGIVLAVFAGVCWFLLPGWRFVIYLIRGRTQEQPNRVRFALICLGVSLGGVSVLALPWPGGITAWGIVDYEPLSVHRVVCPGFLREVHVREGEFVEQGTALATMENPQITLDLKQLELAIEQSRIRARMLHRDGNLVQYQVEGKHRKSLEQQRDELLRRAEGLTITASAAGHVMGQDLAMMEGQYLTIGSIVMSVGDERRKQVRLSVAQQDVDFFLRQVGSQPNVRIKGHARSVCDARLTRVNPRAVRQLPDAALAVPNGGPLPVQAAAGDPALVDGWQLTEPRFLALVHLPEHEASRLRAGELARVRLRGTAPSIAVRFLDWVQNWMHYKLQSRGLGSESA